VFGAERAGVRRRTVLIKSKTLRCYISVAFGLAQLLH